MQSFGTQQLSLSTPAEFNTGVGFQYLQIINSSPYFLNLNFVGQGSMNFSNWFMQDIQVGRAYRGNLIISPENLLGLSQVVSSFVTVNGWSPGELDFPQGLSLSQTSGNLITSVSGQQFMLGVQAADNQEILISNNLIATPGGLANTYLKSFVVTGDKAAAVSTGQMSIAGDPSQSVLYYWINQGVNGTTPFGDTFDPPFAGNFSQATAFTIQMPNLSAGLSIVLKVLSVPVPS